MDNQYLLAYDLGTNGVKVALFTAEGEMAASRYQEYGVQYPHPGWVEQSIQRMWRAQCGVTQALLGGADIKADAIAAVGISSQRATFAPLNKDGNPLADFIGWQDTRGIAQCDRIREEIGADRYYQLAGLPASPTAALSKILWIQEHDPALFEGAAVFGTTQSVHLLQLGVEETLTDLANAGYTGLLDVDQRQWSAELLEGLDIPSEKLPGLKESGVHVGGISREAAAATGLLKGTPIITAGGDLQCASAGLGIVKPGVVSVGIGSGGGISIFLEKPIRHPAMGLNCQPHVVPGSWEMEGICLASGASYKWYRDVLSQAEQIAAETRGLDAYDILNDAAEQAAPGAGGLLFMPSLAGSGAPHWSPQVRGALLGMSLATTKGDLNRAVLEGICLEIRAIIEAARDLGITIDELRIWGGGAKSALWNQISANVYGIPAVKPAIREAGLAGAAICAGVGIGIYPDIAEGAAHFVRIEERYEPDPSLRSYYDEMYDIYRSVYRALVDSRVFERLSGLNA